MENNKKTFINIQLFGEGEPTGDAPAPETAKTVDYEQEYKKQALEIEKLKNAISRTNSENAEYKRRELENKQKELEKMSDEEKLKAHFSELEKAKADLEAKLKEFETRDELLSNGFNKEECDKLVKGGLAIKDFAEIFNKRLEEREKSLKATLLKESTPEKPLSSGTKETQSYAAGLAKRQFNQDAGLQNIKNYYKK